MESTMLGFLLLLLHGSCWVTVGNKTCELMCKFGYYTAMEHSNLTWLYLYISVDVAVCTGDRSMYIPTVYTFLNLHLYLSVFLLPGSIVVEILTVKNLSKILNVLI